jgi:uncharacterized membrane protein
MTDVRQTVLGWAGQGRLRREDLRRALVREGALPSARDWWHFLDRLLLWLGTVSVAAGVIFFLAFNWTSLGRYAKFGLVEVLVIAALVFVWKLGLERPAGKAALLGAALLVGALLALIGQTYQTGADTWELFAVWAVAILPWVLLARFPALWMFWLGLVNLALSIYFQTFPGLFGVLFDTESLLWVLLAVNAAALLLWEGAALGVAWLGERWAIRLLATVVGTIVTTLALWHLFGEASAWGLLAWLAWLAFTYAVYRRRFKDLYMLAGGGLSIIVVLSTFLIQHLLDISAWFLLPSGLIVIALSALAGWWLRNIAAEEAA